MRNYVWVIRRGLGGGLVAFALLAGTAQAAELSVEETFGQEAVTYVAGSGEANDVEMILARNGGEWRVKVSDLGPLTVGDGCEINNTGAFCTTTERPRVDVDLGDGKDRFDGSELAEPGTGKPADPIVVDGGDGDDRLTVISAYSCPDGQGDDDAIFLVDFKGSIAGHGSCFVNGGGGGDVIVGSSRADFIEGDAGADVIKGKAGADGLAGEDGADTIVGGDGGDDLEPGDGADNVRGGLGDDTIAVVYPPPAAADGDDELAGGPGRDSALYLCGGCRLTLDGEFNDGVPGEDDNLDVERVTIQSKAINDENPTVYGPGDDRLEGGDGAEVLRTKRGDDKLIGGGGEDTLDAGNGDDDVRATDFGPDIVDCGPGDDVASVDPQDVVKRCELVGVSLP